MIFYLVCECELIKTLNEDIETRKPLWFTHTKDEAYNYANIENKMIAYNDTYNYILSSGMSVDYLQNKWRELINRHKTELPYYLSVFEIVYKPQHLLFNKDFKVYENKIVNVLKEKQSIEEQNKQNTLNKMDMIMNNLEQKLDILHIKQNNTELDKIKNKFIEKNIDSEDKLNNIFSDALKKILM